MTRNDPPCLALESAAHTLHVRATVVVFADVDIEDLVRGTLAGTSARVVVSSSVSQVADVPDAAAVVVGADVDDIDVASMARLLRADERHRLLALRHGADVSADVPWTVLRKSELSRTLSLLVEEAEAIVVELLARIKDADHPTQPARLGCVVSVASAFVIVAVDEPPASADLVFVLPDAGRQTMSGALSPEFGRPGLWRLSPKDESMRHVLQAFTMRRAIEGGDT